MTTPQPALDLQCHRKIIAALREGVLVIGADRKLLWANEAALTMHGVTDISDLGADADGYRDLFQLQYRNKHRLGSADYPFDRALAGDALDTMIVEVISEGEEEPRWIHQIRSLTLPDDHGDVGQVVLVIQDVSLRFEEEHRFEQTFKVNPAPALIMRLADQHFVKVNQGFLDLTGFARDEVVGRTLYDIDILKDAAQLEIAKERLREGRTVPRCRLTWSCGTEVASLSSSPGNRSIWMKNRACCFPLPISSRDGRQKTSCAIAKNGSSRPSAWRRSLWRLRPATSGVVCDTNEAFHQLAGWSADEAMGKPMSAMRLWTDASFVAAVDKELAGASAFRGKDAQWTGKDGGLTDCLVSAAVRQQAMRRRPIQGTPVPCKTVTATVMTTSAKHKEPSE